MQAIKEKPTIQKGKELLQRELQKLGVKPGEPITLEMLNKARRNLAKEFHPDITKDDGYLFKVVNAAYDEHKRTMEESGEGSVVMPSDTDKNPFYSDASGPWGEDKRRERENDPANDLYNRYYGFRTVDIDPLWPMPGPPPSITLRELRAELNWQFRAVSRIVLDECLFPQFTREQIMDIILDMHASGEIKITKIVDNEIYANWIF